MYEQLIIGNPIKIYNLPETNRRWAIIFNRFNSSLKSHLCKSYLQMKGDPCFENTHVSFFDGLTEYNPTIYGVYETEYLSLQDLMEDKPEDTLALSFSPTHLQMINYEQRLNEIVRLKNRDFIKYALGINNRGFICTDWVRYVSRCLVYELGSLEFEPELIVSSTMTPNDLFMSLLASMKTTCFVKTCNQVVIID